MGVIQGTTSRLIPRNIFIETEENELDITLVKEFIITLSREIDVSVDHLGWSWGNNIRKIINVRSSQAVYKYSMREQSSRQTLFKLESFTAI